MSKWSNINNPFVVSNEGKSIQDTSEQTDKNVIMEEANMLEKCAIRSTDGRIIPVLVDNGTRSVYPIRDTQK